MDSTANSAASTKPTETLANTSQSANQTATAHSNGHDEPPQEAASPRELYARDLVNSLRIAIHREEDPRTGLSSIPKVVRGLLPRFAIEDIYEVIGIWCKIGMLKLHSNGSEPLSSEDYDYCPRTGEGIFFSHMR